MSTSDSSLLAGASVVTQNLFPLFGKKLDRTAKSSGRASWLAINGFIGIVIAVSAAVIYELGVVAWTLLLVGLFVPFAFGMYWKKAKPVVAAWLRAWRLDILGASSPGWLTSLAWAAIPP